MSFYRLLNIGLISCTLIDLIIFWTILPVYAGEKPEYKDIYLTDNRVCKACTWEWVNQRQVQLTNRLGETTFVSPKEISGIDTHPVIRKLFLHSLYGVGLPAHVIVPTAFDDARDYLCKYCNQLETGK